MTTGTISHADSLIGWFVMVKDSQGRYASNKPVWGDGWGWSWFDAANPSVSSRHLPLPGGGVATSNRLPGELQILSFARASNGSHLRRRVPAVEAVA